MDVVHLKALDLIGQPPVLEKVPEFRAFDPPPDDHIKKLYDSAMKFLDALWTRCALDMRPYLRMGRQD